MPTVRLARFFLVALCCASVSAPAPLAARPVALADYTQLRATDARIAAIGFRLARANAALCRNAYAGTGMMLHARGQYGPEGQKALGFASDIAVQAVAPGSPAEQAEIRPGDGLVAVNGAPVGSDNAGADVKALSRKQLDAAYALIEALPPGQPATLSVRRANGDAEILIIPTALCPSRFETEVIGGIAAGADGNYVSISVGMVATTPGEDALAAVIAHEMAHNILEHRRRLGPGGLRAGLLGPLGTKAGRIKRSEIEADRLSLWLLANAGYDIDGAILFWQNLTRTRDLGIFGDGTHPGSKSRVAGMRAEQAMIAAAPVSRGLRMPPILTGVLPDLR